MTRIFVQRGSAGSSSNANRPPSSCLPPQPTPAQSSVSITRDEDQDKDCSFQENPISEETIEQQFQDERPIPESSDERSATKDDPSIDSAHLPELITCLRISDNPDQINSLQINLAPQVIGSASYPPPPPVPPPKPNNSISNSNNLRRMGSGGSNNNSVRIGSSRRSAVWPPVSVRSSGSGSRPSSPRESEGYNSADEQVPCFVSSYDDAERERMFELELRRVKGFEIKRMLEDGNCLFRAVADQVYGDPEAYDMARQMCVDYMERERDHFSQFITEGFTSYCKRKRRDKVYGNNVEIQAFAEMYNRPIHIYSYSTEPINIFQGSYDTDTPPIRLSYHHGNHYNSLVDPRRLTIGAGLGFSSLRGNVDRDQVKAAIKAQQDQQIDNALLAEGRFYSDLELTEREIERMVMETSRAEYIQHQTPSFSDSSSSRAEPSSSATMTGSSKEREESNGNNNINNNKGVVLPDNVLTSSMQLLLAMGFSYMHVMEAYSIFGDDVDSMICYLVELGATSSGSLRRKGKAAE